MPGIPLVGPPPDVAALQLRVQQLEEALARQAKEFEESIADRDLRVAELELMYAGCSEVVCASAGACASARASAGACAGVCRRGWGARACAGGRWGPRRPRARRWGMGFGVVCQSPRCVRLWMSIATMGPTERPHGPGLRT